MTLADGSRRWGRFGAAGVLARVAHRDGSWSYFLARRSEFCHQGGTWAVPGGALCQDEEPLRGALREFAEEIGVDLAGFSLVSLSEDDHGGWSYWTAIIDVPEPFPPPQETNWETSETRWVPQAALADLDLLEPFRLTLIRLGVLAAEEGRSPTSASDRG